MTIKYYPTPEEKYYILYVIGCLKLETGTSIWIHECSVLFANIHSQPECMISCRLIHSNRCFSVLRRKTSRMRFCKVPASALLFAYEIHQG